MPHFHSLHPVLHVGDSVSVEAVERALCGTGYPALRDIQIEIVRGIVLLTLAEPPYYRETNRR